MTGPLARIILRYLAGGLMAYGVINYNTAQDIINDPDLALVAAGIIGLGVEGFYWLAKRKGWST